MEEVKIANIRDLSIRASIECEANRPIYDYVAERMEEKRVQKLFESLNMEVNTTDHKLDCELCDLEYDGCPLRARGLCETGCYFKYKRKL